MFKTTNERGEEVDVYTTEELEEKKNEAVEEYKQANPSDPDVQKLQDELKQKTEELGKLKDKDHNFSQLRQTKEKLETDIEKLNKSIDEKIGIAKKEVLEGMVKEHYTETLKSLSGDDKELSDKIEFHYKRLADVGTTKEEINKKLNDAFVLATGGFTRKTTQRPYSSSGVSPLGAEKSQPVTDEEKEFAKKLAGAGGIKLEDKDF